MTQDEVINIIPRNKRGEPKNDRLKDIAAMLLHYRYDEVELAFFVAEIELFKRPPKEDPADETQNLV